MKTAGLLFFAFMLTLPVLAQKRNCTTTNKAFQAGESITYEILYNWGFIWVSSGEVTFKTERDKFAGNPCWKFSGVGKTYPKFDWFYQVRDTYAAWVDSSSLLPFRYLRDSKEGPHSMYNDNYFSYTRSTVTSYTKEDDKPIRTDTIPITNCAYDVISMIYYARTIDFSKYKEGDKVPIHLYLDSKFYNQYIKYMGKETIETELGKFSCLKFSPQLIEGTIFKGGDDMVVWVTDDSNRVPIKVETPIVVGSIQAILKNHSGLRSPMKSKIEK